MDLKYIETTHATYLATEVSESVYAIHLRGAFVPDVCNLGCSENVARDYVRKKITGKLFDFKIFRTNIESICNAVSESNIASRLIEQLVPSDL